MAEDDFPRTLPDGERLQAMMLEWPDMIGMLRMELQLPDGSMTKRKGVVPLLSDGGGRHRFAFYEPIEGGYRRVGDPVVFADTARPKVERLAGFDVDALRARRIDGNGVLVAYVLRGTVMVEGR
jgi:hypothetical protein